MGLAEFERKKDEKINGVIYDMSPSPNFKHGIINNNINRIIGNNLKNSLCLVFMENLDFKYQPDVNDDYLCPDIMVVCDRKYLKGGAYYGVPKFVAETLSHSTAKRDKTEKKDIYEKAGVEEYWIISRQGALEIYYLEDGAYKLKYSYILQKDEDDMDYNPEISVILKGFPHITMTLAEIFEGTD